MQSTQFLSTPDDVLDLKAITEYERDRQRAHKGHDGQRKKFTGFNVHSHQAPAWKRVSANTNDEKERHASMLSRHSRPMRAWREYRERVDDSEDTADEGEELTFGKENKPSAQNSPTAMLVLLEDLVVRPAGVGKKSRQHSPKLISRSTTPRPTSKQASFDSVSLTRQFAQLDITTADNLVDPLMDTYSFSISGNTAAYNDDDDDDDIFEFSSPGAEEWTVVMAEDGSVRYTTASSLVTASTATTTFSFMPCVW